jgi:hypothetical protein
MNNRYGLLLALMCAGVAYGGSPPTATSVSAAQATAKDNVVCKSIEPFYWEIGDASGTLTSASVGVDSKGTPVLATTKMDVASASKWLYATYVVQIRKSAANLTAQDINFLHQTSGYTNMGGDGHPAGTCPPSDSPDSINACLVLINATDDLPYNYQDPATIGFFDYDAGHFENHASLYTGLGDLSVQALGPGISRQLGTGVKLVYSQPLLAGGINMTPATYALVLQHIVDGSLFMHDALGTSPVCTLASPTCTSLNSPVPFAWHYSIGHWVEDDPANNDDGAFSGTGGQGFYPWVEASKVYYGLVGRVKTAAGQQGQQSIKCGALVRRAWDTGVQQKGRTPVG